MFHALENAKSDLVPIEDRSLNYAILFRLCVVLEALQLALLQTLSVLSNDKLVDDILNVAVHECR